MKIKHCEHENRDRFFVETDRKKTALLTYSIVGLRKIVNDHTEVDDSLKGNGVGCKLVEAAVGYLRVNDIKGMSLCRFASTMEY